MRASVQCIEEFTLPHAEVTFYGTFYGLGPVTTMNRREWNSTLFYIDLLIELYAKGKIDL